MKTIIFVREVVGYVPYWACGESMSKARANFKKFSRKFPSSRASIVAFTGESKLLEAITIDDMGTINHSKKLCKVVLQY